jgi:uncharacterized protein
MSGVEFGLMLSLGLLSSLHCAQMCGPIVISYSLASIKPAGSSGESGAPTSSEAGGPPSPIFWPKMASQKLTQLFGHLAYNAGRILTYCALGAVAGLAGRSMTWMGQLAGLSHTASIVAGVLMILGGIAMFGWLPKLAALGQSSAAVTSRFLRPFARLLSAPDIGHRFALGLALGFLPCGLVYVALMKSLSAGTVLGGALDMLAFGLGTATSLLAIGLLSTSFSVRGTLARHASQIAATAVIVMGAVLLWRASIPIMTCMGSHGHH